MFISYSLSTNPLLLMRRMVPECVRAKLRLTIVQLYPHTDIYWAGAQKRSHLQACVVMFRW